ncbi:DNA-binding IclR family transcriptional regulator [Nocardioides luteus]|uniref:IclR family transcriptional regulator n=1 Tax=Nocardioides luteus TaxID=1844 RepID=A0ABQ5SYC6_9ACTN|nr:IclR family transcriptional regulator [Nocardioides luteus]MDR7312591.1 DNA-binding IclR family transcriptional regulator [Nocardioides luteus]GGR46121.1 IclR family transcriptional regulator [Nocardioides luteus]GLJ68839.1 IclR family transcriptional regulator [Nocardioides luteus]
MTATTDGFPSAPEHSAPPQYPIESVDNALRLLWLLSERRSLRLTEASQYLGVASSTAHRLLAMLQYRGFVRQDPSTKAYEPGPSLDRIAFALLRRLDIRDLARPVLEKLNEATGETVHLGTLEGATVRYLDSLESPRAVRVASRSGGAMPAHCTSTGKAMLATLDDAQVIALYPDEALPQQTSKSVATRTALLGELATIRAQGFAISDEESEEGVWSVAVPVGGAPMPTALNISVPISRMNVKRRKEMAGLARKAVADLETELR